MTGATSKPVAERALLEMVVANLNDAVLITEGTSSSSEGRRIVFVNRAFTAMTGFSEEEALRSTPGLTVGPLTDRGVLDRIQAARAALLPIRVELLKYRKDGSTFWVELDVLPVLDGEGQCTHFVGVMRDISERKLLSAKLLESDRMAALGTLVAGLAHEINNPLTYLIADLDHIASELPKEASLLASLEEARSGAEKVRSIVGDLQAFSRPNDAPLVPCDPRRVLDATIDLARNALEAKATVVKSYVGTSVVSAPPSKLGQVLLNVLLNAAQAIPEGAPEAHRILVSVRPEEASTVIEISDTGSGIPEESLLRVFDPFFTTKPVGVGTGLGLWVSRQIVTGLGGTIEARSKVGAGTVLRIALPSLTPAPEPAPKAPEAPVVLGPIRVLVVDDDAAVAAALARLIARRHEVEVALGGKAALSKLEQEPNRFAAILCDLMMPEIDGAALHQRLVVAGHGDERRMIFMTGGAFTESATRFLDGVPNLRLDKPIDRDRLFEALASLVSPAPT